MMKKRNHLSLTEKAVKAMSEAAANTVEEHRRRGIPLAVWRNGRVVSISPWEVGALHEKPMPYRAQSRGKKS